MTTDPSGEHALHARVLHLAEAALKQAAGKRESFLRSECGDDDRLFERVKGIVNHYDETGTFLDQIVLPEVTISEALASDDPEVWKEFLGQISAHRSTWERYDDQGELARGGMGAIHKVRDSDLRRTLAMKLILTQEGQVSPSKSGASLGRFLEEAQVTSQLDHPGIVPVHEIGVDEQERVYFTMKLVKGDDLRAVFDRVADPADGEWNSTRALATMLRVCEAMAYAHAKGVIHRDLKPANVMVGKFGETYVMDWGLARILNQSDSKDLRLQTPMPTAIVMSERKQAQESHPDAPLITMDGTVVGTPAYMPPEQASGRIEQMGPHSDVYAVGAMLYELLSGQTPYITPGDRISPHTLLLKVMQGPPRPLHELNPEIPAELAAICGKAMAREIPDRYTDMSALAEDIRAYLEQRVVRAYETGAFAELRKWIARNKGVTRTAAAALLVLAAVLWWSFINIGREKDIALANEQKAQAEKQRADDKAEKMGRLSDVKELADLVAELDELWPAHPDQVEPMKIWLGRAEGLLGRWPAHRQTLEDLRSQGSPADGPLESELEVLRENAANQAQELEAILAKASPTSIQPLRAAGEVGLDRLRQRIMNLEFRLEHEQPYFFADPRLAWWYETLVGLSSGLAEFSVDGPHAPTTANMRARLRFAESIEDHSITFYADEWEEAIASIADPDDCADYAGLEISEQIGLVPIGRDPESGLWEFWHVQTGQMPQRDEEGFIVVAEGMGLVFVLLPGATFSMGAQSQDPDGTNYDSQADPFESNSAGEAVRITLDPFFLSKYELTQGIWQRLTGTNPSTYGAGNYSEAWNQSGLPWSATHPVESVTWEECSLWLGRLGLTLPTEAQWEYGCRAGTQTSWWVGADLTDLNRAANLADSFRGRAVPSDLLEINWEPRLSDGQAIHARVGSYPANPFGLHDTIGNVAEWCLDSQWFYDGPVQAGNGSPLLPDGIGRARRGGAFAGSAFKARSAARSTSATQVRNQNFGCRPARVLEE